MSTFPVPPIRPLRSVPARDLRGAAFVVAGIALLYFARDTFIPLGYAIVLALVLAPAVNALQKLKVHRVPAALGVMLLSATLLAGLGYVIFNQLVDVANDLPRYAESIHKRLQGLGAPAHTALGRATTSVNDLKREITAAQEPAAIPRSSSVNITSQTPVSVRVVDGIPGPVEYVLGYIRPFISPFATLAIVLVVTLFLLIEQSDLRNRLLRLVGLSRLNAMTQALDDATHRVSRYLLLQVVVNAAFGLICTVGLYFIGLPYAVLWGVVVAILRIVPYVGSAVAALLPFLLSLAVFEHWMPPILVLALFFTLELVTANFLEPLLYGAHTGISSLALLLTTIFWTTLWGPAGLILSTPLTVCVVVLGRHVPHLGFLHILLGDQPALVPLAQFYQRLLALDDFEARAIVAAYRTDHSVIQLYDEVILPALSLAEQDRHQGTLDLEREEFLFLHIHEILAELDEGPEALQEATGALASGRVICLPANDEADEIAAGMLAQLIGQAGRAAISVPLTAVIDAAALTRFLELVAPTAADTFCVSTVPPLAFAHARTLSVKLRTWFPGTPILVGIWGFSGGTDRALKLFRPTPPEKFATTLADAFNYLVEPATEPAVV